MHNRSAARRPLCSTLCLLNWCLSLGLISSVPLRGRVCCNRNDTLFVPPAEHFVRTKCSKALRGHPLKPHFTRAGNRLVISHNGTPSKKTSGVCPARTLLHIFLAVSAFASGCLHRRSSLQDTRKTRHTTEKAELFGENRRSVRAGQTLRHFRFPRAANRSYADHLL